VKLPLPPVEVPNSTDVSKLAPRFRAAVIAALNEMRAAGYDPIISETIRSNERQQFLYGFGRSYDDGRGIVTNSQDALHTWHGFGLAVDVISRSRQWDAPDDFWQALGVAARDEGLHWGGDWPEFKDKPHIQWGDPMLRSPSAHAAELLAEGGLPAVWREVRADG